jgi:hypothetical protein
MFLLPFLIMPFSNLFLLLRGRELWCRLQFQKYIEKQWRSIISKDEGYACLFTNLNAIDIKQRTYTYHHQGYMLQFQETSKVHRLNSTRNNIPQFAFKYCPFPKLPSKDVPLKPLIGMDKKIFTLQLLYVYYM